MSLAVRVIPCLDVRDGVVVKGERFQALREVGRVEDLALRYGREGADELVILDVAATVREKRHRRETVAAVRRALDIPVTVGGGVRTVDDARELLEAGADKVAVNSAAVARPELLAELSAQFGRQCTVLAIDARAAATPGAAAATRYEVLTHAGQRPSGDEALEWAARAEALGAGEILLTSWDRDGTGIGYDTELLAAMRRAVRLPVIASGGAARPEDAIPAVRAGASAVLAAGMFHSRRFSIGDVKQALAAAGVEVRT